MYLKQLELLGFKSFPNKTVVSFAEGVTAIVGPNGCGKTNILDALRWVLGEQRPTLLRGGKMEEVIFNGTGDLKPLGMAEVTLTVVNDRGVLPTEYHEVQITRRLYRNDESEYLLNKVPCRLKDITDLFVDTGMGAHSYSVIQQDMIEAVISDKAEERRFLFEEAAGITKYKQRKRAALRKLESTENDFLRLNDIYAEVKSRVVSLQRQQKKAERFVQVRDEIQAWELFLGSRRFRDMEQQLRTLRVEHDRQHDQRLAVIAAFDVQEAALQRQQEQVAALEQSLAAVSADMYARSEAAHEAERALSVLTTREETNLALISRNDEELRAIAARLEQLSEQIVQADLETEQQTAQLTALAAELAHASALQAERDRDLVGARVAKERESSLLSEIDARLSSGRTEESGLKEQEAELAGQLESARQQIADMNWKKQESVVVIAEQERLLAEARAQRDQLEETLTHRTVNLEQLLAVSEDLATEISSLTASAEACEARRRLLEEMMVTYEGYEAGAVSILEQRGRWPGIFGTVAEKFVPADGIETALEAALGEAAGFLICDHRNTAESIIAFLKRERKGKVGLLVPTTGGLVAGMKRPTIDLPGVLGWLDSFVRTDDSLQTLMEAVLSRTLLFDSAVTPTAELLERLPYGFSAVSTDGICYGAHALTGGSDDRVPLFRRREKVDEQAGLLQQMQQELEKTRQERHRCLARVAELRAESAGLSAQIESAREHYELQQRALDQLHYTLRSTDTEIERLRKDEAQVNERLVRIQQRQYSLTLDYGQLASKKESIVASLHHSGRQLESIESLVAQAVDALARLQLRQVELSSNVQAATRHAEHLRELTRELQQNQAIRTAESDRARSELTGSAEQMRSLQAVAQEAYQQRDALQTQLQTMRADLAALQEHAASIEKESKRLRAERDQIGTALHALELQMGHLQSEQSHLADQLHREYDIDIRQAEARHPNADIPVEDADRHLHDLKERLKGFGAVNLVAIEEYREFSERELFLAEQIKDLSAAKADLQATIAKINQTAKELFEETMNKVQAHFRKLFVELFNGGDAEVRLENPDDPLESTIEITARPRGKKQLPITMMSGGERALTAISLLFSLYLVKPSPFCILDEIDAPLDDANCRRFLNIIRNFSGQTQFITITHNKITMEAADNLYGITMEQAGVSKLVAVRFTGGVETTGSSAPLQVLTLQRGPEAADQLPDRRADLIDSRPDTRES